MNKTYFADFNEGDIYHVYNRTNNRELLFCSDENRFYFLNQYKKYLTPFLDCFSWSFLPNHFHFPVQVKSAQKIRSYLETLPDKKIKQIEKKYLHGKVRVSDLMEIEWRRFFTAYSMAFNKVEKRTGNLFHRPFKRVQVNDDEQFTQTVIYIHANAQKHGVCSDFRDYPWSSWKTLLSDKPTILKRDYLIDWFDGRDRLITVHSQLIKYYYE